MKISVIILASMMTFVHFLDAGLVINENSGYQISWDGNEGDHFDQAVPNNLALASNGATAISSGDLGSQFGYPYHFTSNLNDGVYGNNGSWIGEVNGAGPVYAGVMFSSLHNIESFAFGRDNGTGPNEVTQFTDRSLGDYTIQYTQNGIDWTTIGMLEYNNIGNDQQIGGAFTPHYRHEYALGTTSSNFITALGFRVLVPNLSFSEAIAIDELEVYGTLAVPEPTSFSMVYLGILIVGAARKGLKF